jgi:3',5'-cyclic-AMP phosphodiesterase
MTDPFLLFQLSDPHIGADWHGVDPAAKLSAAVEAVRRVRPGPDAVVVSGDLAEHAADPEYRQLQALLEPIEAPLYVLSGNHDDRDALHRNFDVPGAEGAFVQYSVDLGAMRLVVLDTTRPGEEGGELDDDRLAWLDAELAADPSSPTVIAMHHPPILTGIRPWDEIGLPAGDRRALARVVRRHRQVLRLVGGHLHRTIAGDLAGRCVLAAPSTYMQGRLDFRLERLEVVAEPAGFAVHALLDGELFSHVQPVA